MDNQPRYRSSRSSRTDASGRSDSGVYSSDARPRRSRPRQRRLAAGPVALIAILVVVLVVAVPVGLSWARGRKPSTPQSYAPAVAPVPVSQSASEPVSSATEPAAAKQDAALAPAEAAAAAVPPVEDTSWQEKYKGKLVLGFKPEPGYKAVALTFDDGPNYQTRTVLKHLAKYEARGTFFFSGVLLKRKDATKHAVLVEEAGSEVANHTMNHAIDDISAMWRRPYGFNLAQATGPDKLLKPVIGHNTLWLRPMGGNIDATGIKAANDSGHLVINWTVDSNDSHGGPRTPDYIYRQCTENVKSGDVILLHVTKAESMKALPKICAELDRQGFKIVTLSELASHSTPITAKVPK